MRRTLMNIALASALALSALPSPAADEAHTVPASPHAMRALVPYHTVIEAKSGMSLVESSRGTGQMVLDVLDGKAPAAAIAMPLPQAVDAARLVAWEEGRLLIVPDSIEFHPIGAVSIEGLPIGVVTVGNASQALKSVLAELR